MTAGKDMGGHERFTDGSPVPKEWANFTRVWNGNITGANAVRAIDMLESGVNPWDVAEALRRN